MSTKVTNKQIADVFRASKNFLIRDSTDENWRYRTPYICCAIADVRGYTAASKIAATAVISKRLGNQPTVRSWLIDKGYFTKNTFAYHADMAQQIQLYRHRWLDSLIEEFSK